MNTPLVSVCCITYNHAQFIRKCLDGFLMQKTNFPIEILIHDDCSTDGTTEIIRDYEAKYPDLIFPLYEEENQYQKGKAAEIDLYNYRRARGKYIAYCEGDDYWTDPLKLQKQVDFMEANPEYSVCWHRSKQFIVETGEYIEDKCQIVLGDKIGVDIDLETYFTQWYTQPLTMLFRLDALEESWRKQYKLYRDQHEIYHLLKRGRGYLFAFEGGIYVKHNGGIYTSLSNSVQSEMSLYIAKELYEVNKDQYTRNFYAMNLQRQIYEKKDLFCKKWKYSWDLFFIERKVKSLIRNLIR